MKQEQSCSVQSAPLEVGQREGHRRLRVESDGSEPRRQDHRRAGARGRKRVPLPRRRAGEPRREVDVLERPGLEVLRVVADAPDARARARRPPARRVVLANLSSSTRRWQRQLVLLRLLCFTRVPVAGCPVTVAVGRVGVARMVIHGFRRRAVFCSASAVRDGGLVLSFRLAHQGQGVLVVFVQWAFLKERTTPICQF
jgi:hypothetical protein